MLKGLWQIVSIVIVCSIVYHGLYWDNTLISRLLILHIELGALWIGHVLDRWPNIHGLSTNKEAFGLPIIYLLSMV